jgi:hypothetical protein
MPFGMVMLMICGLHRSNAQSAGIDLPRRHAATQEQPPKGGTQSAGMLAASVIEVLPDGGYVVEIGGVKFRAITDDQLRTIQKRKARLEGCEKDRVLADAEIDRLKAAIELVQKDAQLATAQTAIERERAGRFEAMYQGEQALRLQAEALAKRGKVSRFFDKPAVQIGLKLALPIVGIVVRR